MAIYAIGDLHLSLDSNKQMDVFAGWDNYMEKIRINWENTITAEDTVIICGDVSWGMSLQQSLKDFTFIDKLPGEKIILKGNHDYWWTTMNKMEKFLEENNLTTIKILHNNSYTVENIAICGSRGWIFENGQPLDEKIIAREAQRLRTSLEAAEKGMEKIAFLHYPPVYNEEISQHIIDALDDFEIKICYYGHIHSGGHRYAIDGMYLGIDFNLISADYINFTPKKVR